MNQSSTDTISSSYSQGVAQLPKTADNIQAWFVTQIAEQLTVDPGEIDVRETFENYSLDSAQALAVAGRAEKFLGFQLSPTLLWHYPTIAALSERLAEEAASDADLLAAIDDETLAQALAEIEQQT
ncbi:phosphopantetheine-binding protein [Phormidesmis priestleyi]